MQETYLIWHLISMLRQDCAEFDENLTAILLHLVD